MFLRERFFFHRSQTILSSTTVIPCIVTDSLWIKPTDALNSSFVGITTLHVSGSLFAHHQEFLTVHRRWYILCSCDDCLLPGVGLNCVPSITCSWKYCKIWSCNKSPTSNLKIYLGEFLSTFVWDDVKQTVSKDAPGGHVSTAWVVKVPEII
jgi:hypothetical protein